MTSRARRRVILVLIVGLIAFAACTIIMNPGPLGIGGSQWPG